MESRRQLKMGSVMQQAFAEILNREGKSLYGKAFVTLTHARVTADLSLVRFYLSIYNAADPDSIIQRFNEHRFELKRKLIDKLRHQLRVMPDIEFFRDETLEYAFHMEEVLKKVKADDESLRAELETRKKAKAARKISKARLKKS